MAPIEAREAAWSRLVSDLPSGMLDAITEVVHMSSLPEQGASIMAGQTRGRIVVDPAG